MNDDDFSGLVRSGSKHSVSVSEHTGNAKTPQNKVMSHEEETEALKRSFEEQALAAQEEEKALAAALAEHTHALDLPDTATDANIQIITGDKGIKNNQTVANDGAAKANLQSIPTSAPKANSQTIESETYIDNIQALSSEKAAANRQSMADDKAIDTNRQAIDTQAQPKNRQSISTEEALSNTQNISSPDAQDNQQLIEEGAQGLNRQPISQASAIAPNNQAIGTPDPSLNRQGVGNGNIQSHFEALPSDKIERKKVDFPTGDNSPSTGAPHTTAVAAEATRKPVTKLAPAPRVPMTAQELENAKRQREKFSDAFHGRLAGIKHNVEELNERLTDFEEKVQKDDAKLIKGDPNNFKVDLG